MRPPDFGPETTTLFLDQMASNGIKKRADPEMAAKRFPSWSECLIFQFRTSFEELKMNAHYETRIT